MADNANPHVAPSAAIFGEIGHENQAVIINPMISNGNKYASGIILRRRSAIAICITQKIANTNKNVKKI